MMRRSLYKKYLILGALLFLILSLPMFFVEKIRGCTVATFSNLFRGTTKLRGSNHHEKERLEGENHLLRIEIGKLRALIEQQGKVEGLAEEMQRSSSSVKRYEETKFLLGQARQSVPARVIYRDPASWSSACWVNVGEETNTALNKKIIKKNSPVILGRSVVGAVDYVGKKQSRIRLITDTGLKPSVRALRGMPQHILLIEHIDPILRHLHGKNDQLTSEERTRLEGLLKKFKQTLSQDVEAWYLAKGVLQGTGGPLWRSVNQTLRGVGFNYDFGDEEGPARELATGKPIDELGAHSTFPTLPIIKVNDLLVTTGLDGVFPPGLCVAEVTKVYPLREGAYTYEIEATPVVGNLDSLHNVFIIPPLGNIEDENCQSTRDGAY